MKIKSDINNEGFFFRFKRKKKFIFVMLFVFFNIKFQCWLNWLIERTIDWFIDCNDGNIDKICLTSSSSWWLLKQQQTTRCENINIDDCRFFFSLTRMIRDDDGKIVCFTVDKFNEPATPPQSSNTRRHLINWFFLFKLYCSMIIMIIIIVIIIFIANFYHS